MAREIGNRKSPEKSEIGNQPGNQAGNQKSTARNRKSPARKSRKSTGKSPEKSGAEIGNRKSHRYGTHVSSPLYPVSDPTMAEALRKIMDEKGVSIAELSRRTGVSSNTVSAIVAAKRMGNIATWMAFARALGTTLAEIEKESMNV